MKFIIAILGVLAVIGVYQIFSDAPVTNPKYNECVTAMQKAIPDANDTAARSKYLEDCQR